MTQEYDEKVEWIELPEGGTIQWDVVSNRYRILTPKPRREFVVGKWYINNSGGCWRKVIAVDGENVWLERADDPRTATCWSKGNAVKAFDWSVSPRDEAPE